MVKRTTVLLVIALCALGANAYAYDFWGINMGTEVNPAHPSDGSQLAFSAPPGGIQYAVGGYKYTKVGTDWTGAYAPASPGPGYAVYRMCDALAVFFKPETAVARFTVFTGMPQTGTTAPECGYQDRVFGPGDLKIDIGGVNYGVGFRVDDLLWATQPGTTSPYYKIYKATGGTDSIYARDDGTTFVSGGLTFGDVVENPQWDHVDNHLLPASNPSAFAFFVNDTGTARGSAPLTVSNTGVTLGGAPIYAYEVSVEWSLLGIGTGPYSFTASWRPDCGNDLITANFSGDRPPGTPVPEPYSIVLAITGLLGVGALKRRG